MSELGNTPKAEKAESPIDTALDTLSKNIELVQEALPIFESKLATVICQPEKPNPETETVIGGQTLLEQRLRKMADDTAGINAYLRELQNRIQI